jgi:hypothetical protein
MLEGLLIASLCSGIGTYEHACSNAARAASIQSGTSANISLVENTVRNKAEKYRDKVPESLVAAVGVAEVIRTKQVNFSFKLPDLCDRVEVRAGNSQQLTMGWNF